MSSIQALGISGLRSYSPTEMQKIQFMKPLTLIYGKNGSGKTALKFITIGAYPPNSDRGKNFVMDSKIAGHPQVSAEVRMKFLATNERPVLAKRKLLMTVSSKTTKVQSKQQVLKTKNEKGQQISINHQCAQIQKQIPQFLGISKPILDNIVFCHQDDSLWPFSDNNTLKNIFDELFETKKFTKIIEAIWEKHKAYSKQLKELHIHLKHLTHQHQTNISRKAQILDTLTILQEESKQAFQMGKQLREMQSKISDTSEDTNFRNKLLFRKGGLESQIKATEENIKAVKLGYLERTKNKGKQQNEIYIPEVNIAEVIENLGKKEDELEKAKHDKEGLESMLNEIKSNQRIEQNTRQLQIELKRVIQLFPDLQSSNSKDIIIFLQQEELALNATIQRMNEIHNELKETKIMNCIELKMSSEECRIKKREYNEGIKSLQKLKQRICQEYNSHYRVIQNQEIQKLNRQIVNPKIVDQIKEMEIIIGNKQQQLKYYRNMSNEQYTIKDINKLEYVGIELQDQIIHYCQDHKKCYCCKKQLNKQDLELMKNNIIKIKNKTNKKLKQIKINTNYIDPIPMIANLEKYIQQSNYKLTQLQRKYQLYQQQKYINQQIKKNQFINNILFQNQINPHKIIHNHNNNMNYLQFINAIQQVIQNHNNNNNNMTYQQFINAIQQYGKKRQQLQNDQKQILNYIKSKEYNLNVQKQQQQQSAKKQNLLMQLRELDQRARNKQLVENMLNKLKELMKSVRIGNKKTKKGTSSLQLNNKILAVNNRIQHLSEEIQQLRLDVKGIHLMKQYQIKQDQLLQIQKELKRVNNNLQQTNQLHQQYNNKRIQYEKKIQQIDIRTKQILYENTKQSIQYYNIRMKIQQYQNIINDIHIICKSIQQSVNTYHNEKMQEINRIILQIWQQIYHADDIDFIKINTQIQQEQKRKKNYHYHIVMVKKHHHKNNIYQQTIHMKGRCSMGQKVLASIVIRLALAEAFSTNSRILALDQPTTNLDRKHINNLANQLGKLIQLNGGKNLQLIIISHDLEFIAMLEEYTSYYYEIKRNKNNFSIITKRDIKSIYANENN